MRGNGRERGIEVGALAPDFQLSLLGKEGDEVRLSNLRGRPVVLVFGSYSCSPFRRSLSKLNRVYKEFRDRVHFYLVYMQEEHPDRPNPDGVSLSLTTTLAERAANATICAVDKRLEIPILLDQLEDDIGVAYDAQPNRLYLLDEEGRVIFSDEPDTHVRQFRLAAAIRRHLGNRDATNGQEEIPGGNQPD